MSQNWTDDCFAADHQGLTDLQNIENNLQCLKTAFSGDSAPSSPSAGQWWYDTLSNLLKIRNEANSAWIDVYDFGNDQVASGKVKTASLADNVLSADATGRGRMQDGYITAAKIGTGEVTGVRIATSAIDASKLAAESVTGAKLQDVASGSRLLLATADTEKGANYAAYTKVKEILVNRKGAVTVYFELKASPYGITYGRIYRNGSAVGTERSTTTNDNYVSWSENISVSVGDYLQLYTYASAPAYTSYCRNFRLYIGYDATNAVVYLD